jgi:hypothetical protein
MAEPDRPTEAPDQLRVARAQLDSLEDHCETARARLAALQEDLAGADGSAARRLVAEAFEAEPSLQERCRAIRTNTFDALDRQLSKLVVAAPEAAEDLSAAALDRAMAELVEHHDRLLAAVGRLEDIAQSDDGETAETARRATDDAVQAVTHIDSTASYLRCLLAKGVARPPVNGAAPATEETADDAAFVVTGTVTQDGEPLEGLTVRAVDRDLGGEEPLGEATTDADGRYRIGYTAADFERNERGTADVLVRVVDAAGTTVAESELRFNAGREATVDVAVPPGETVSPTEYDRLRADLAPLVDDRSVASLSDDQVAFLTDELAVADRGAYPAGEQTLELLRTAARLAGRTPFEVRTLYGLARQRKGLSRDGLAGSDAATLADQLEAADRARIVAIRTEGLQDRLAALLEELRRAQELEQGTEHRTTIAVRTPADDPLVGAAVRVQDPEDDRKQRTFRTGSDGRVSFAYTQPATTEDPSRQFRLTVRNEAGATVHEATVTVHPEEVTAVTVREVGAGFAGADTLESLGSREGVELPRVDGLSDVTLGEVRRAGGVENLEGASAVEPATRERVNALASLDLLADPQTSSSLATAGYTDPVAVAETPLAEFQASMDGTLEPDRAAELHRAALAQTYLFDSLLVDQLASLRNGTAPVDGAAVAGGGDGDGE